MIVLKEKPSNAFGNIWRSVKHDDVWCNLFCSNYQSYANKKDLWLIWDHPNNKNNINGVRTNNTEYAIILIQRLEETKGFQTIFKTNYYNFWDNKYFKEIVLEGLNYEDRIYFYVIFG